MIPKTIHYIWFGGNALPEEAKRCIESWRRHCPDYKIICWDESNFDLSCNEYVEEAYQAKKWAFVSDYVRLWVLVTYGGIYMDTDVEVLKSLDPFLGHKAFSGFESPDAIPTGIMACEKGFSLFKELLDDYDDRHFLRKDGSYDLNTNVVAITRHHETGQIQLTENSVTIHHFSGSWVDSLEKQLLQKRRLILKKHPKLPPLLVGAFVRLRYGFSHGDFAPFVRMVKLYHESHD